MDHRFLFHKKWRNEKQMIRVSLHRSLIRSNLLASTIQELPITHVPISTSVRLFVNMKDVWLRQQQQALQQKDIDTEIKIANPSRVWRLRPRSDCLECVNILRCGDLMVVSCTSGGPPTYLTTYSTDIPFQRRRILEDGVYPKRINLFTRSLYDDVFATLDESNVLRAVRARSDLELYAFALPSNLEITDMSSTYLGAEYAIIILGDGDGVLHFVSHDGLKQVSDYRTFSHPDIKRIDLIVAYRTRFAVSSDDGMVSLWDATTRKRIGSVRNSCDSLGVIDIDSHHVATYFDGVLRVYENQPGLALKYFFALPIDPQICPDPMFRMLTNRVAVVHDEKECFVFFDLRNGKVIHRLRTPFVSVFSISVLRNGHLLMSSYDSDEGHAIVAVNGPPLVYEALCADAVSGFGEIARPNRRRWRWRSWQSLVVVVSAVGCVLKLRRNHLV